MHIEAARYCVRYPQVNDGWQEVAGRRQRSESCLGRGVCFDDGDAVRGSIGAAASALPANFDQMASFGAADPILLWQFVIGAVVALAFLIAVVLWAVAALNRVKRAFSRGTTLVTTALDMLSDGVVIVNRHDKVVFCNDRYLEIYGLTRSDITSGLTGLELFALRRSRGIPEVVGEGAAYPGETNGSIVELSNGRSILVKRYSLPNGGAAATHEDCTERRSLARQLASANSFLESIVDNVPVCSAAKN
ncbi:MAG: PAS-domain containing protein, partial [Rhizobiales bacterium]|nr:PAS-domain containing protein [Hyphomicrobiales bacterium]